MKKIVSTFFILFLLSSFVPGHCSNTWTVESPSKNSNRRHINLESTYEDYKDFKTWKLKKRRKKKEPPTVTICVFDNIIAPHRLFSGKTLKQRRSQKNSNCKEQHGTHVAGIIGGRSNSNDDWGVFPDAVLDSFYTTITPKDIDGRSLLPYPEQEWHILNASCYISKSRSCGYRAFKYPANDTLIVYAADNYFSPGLRKSRHMVRWAEAENMLGYLLVVGNLVITEDGFQPPYKEAFASLTYLPSLHNLIFAPGRNVNSTISMDQFITYSGTSMATPYVSGAAALLKRLHMRLPMNMIALALKKGATHKHIPGFGQGVLHVDRANFVAYLLEDVLRKTASETVLKKERVLNSIRDYNLILNNYKKSRFKRTLIRNAKSLFAKGLCPRELTQREKKSHIVKKRERRD